MQKVITDRHEYARRIRGDSENGEVVVRGDVECLGKMFGSRTFQFVASYRGKLKPWEGKGNGRIKYEAPDYDWFLMQDEDKEIDLRDYQAGSLNLLMDCVNYVAPKLPTRIEGDKLIVNEKR